MKKLLFLLTVTLFASSAHAALLFDRNDSSWRYFKGITEASSPDTTAWRARTFNDAAFTTGAAPFWYGDVQTGGTQLTDMINTYASVFLRKTFVINNPASVASLRLGAFIDDGFVAWINGVEVARVGVSDPITKDTLAVNATEPPPFIFYNVASPTMLVAGTNVLAVQIFNTTLNSSDLGFDASLEATIDDVPPTIVNRTPAPGGTVPQLSGIQITFSESVTNVDATDLLINNVPATNLVAGSPTTYNFQFAQPAPGPVTVAFATGHGITDLAVPANAFAGLSWSYTLDPNVIVQPFLISEFLAANSGNQPNSIRDEDGDSSDWIEIYNPRATVGDISGWFLTDATNNLTKWRIPNGVTVPARGYLIIFASGKNRTNTTGRLHTNFQLNNNGEYLALLDPSTNIVSQFAPEYPSQNTDISYGRDRADANFVGFFVTPTPGADNSTTGAGFGSKVHFSRNGGTFVGSFQLVLTSDDTNNLIRYTLESSPGTFLTATNVPTQSSTLYTGPITITNSVQVRARAFSTNASFFPGQPHSESYIAMTGPVTNFSSSLPIMVIHAFGTVATSLGTGFPAVDNAVVVACFDNDNDLHRAALTDKPQLVKRAGINIRGSSTSGLPKGSWAVELWDEFNDDDSASVLGLPAESDWVLYAPNQFDPTGLHNPLFHQFGREAGLYSSRTRFVEVFYRNGPGALNADITLNGANMGDYWGVYVLEEKVKIDKNRVDIDKLEPEQSTLPDITGGYLIKIDRTDGNERTFSAGGQTYNYQDPDGLEMVPPATPGRSNQAAYLTSYLDRFNTALTGATLTNATGTNHYSYYLDITNSLDSHIMNVLTMNVDGYRLSGYFYKPRNGKFTFGPLWDVDRGLGTTQKGGDWRAFNPRAWMASNPLGASDYGTDFFQGSTPPTWMLRLFTDPDFWQTWIDRYQRLRATSLDTNHVTKLVDDFANEIRDANPREVRRWGGIGVSDTSPRSGVTTSPNFDYTHTFPTPGTFQGEVDFQKKWLVEHINFMDTNLLNRPVFSANEGMVSAGATVTLLDKSGKAGTKIFYTLDGSDPRGPQGTTNASAREYVGPITITNNVRIRARAINPNHRNMTGSANVAAVRNPVVSTPWSGDNAATFFVTTPALRITELMYHPAPGPNPDVTDSDDYEYIELKNVGATALDLTGIHFVNGVTFDFTGSAVTSLAPGGYVLIVNNIAAFTSRYGSRTNIAGVYSGNLDNSGERIALAGALGEPILDFTYNDRWYPATDGQGFALITANENAAPSAWDSAANWRASRNVGGSPGVADPAPQNFPAVVINEALTHTDLPSVDAIELFNTGSTVADIGGWYLTDDPDRPQKYFIPVGTTIPARGFLVFYETNKFNLGATNFALSSEGDEVYLFSATDGNLTGYSHGFDFGAGANGVSFGRYINSQGAEHFVAQAANTLGASNALPKVGPIVISEFMYHPPDNFDGVVLSDNSLDEFIELHNISGTNVALTGPAGNFPADFLNTWELSKGVDFKFPIGVTIPANGYVLVVNFDPNNAAQRAAFVTKYAVPTNTPIFGPYGGKLDNSSGSIKLSRPDTQGTNGNVPYIEVDQVDYTDTAPWPTGADGVGLSLSRILDTAYGNDPTNWAGARPTPGVGFVPGAAPVITQQPQGFTVTEATSTNLSVTVSGTGPFSYQWRFNGNVLPGATSSTLAFPGILPSQSGIYSVAVLNSGGAVFSSNVTVTVRPLPVITVQPANVRVRPGTNYTFTVAASGTGPLTYQWRFNGTNIAGATSTSLPLTNVQLYPDSGFYDVVVTDSIGSRLSETGSLVVLVAPVITNNPPGLIVPSSVIQGRDAIVTVVAGPNHPLLPLSIRWLRNAQTYITNGPATVVYTNVQIGTTVRVAVTNLAGTTASSTITLNVITNSAPDSDNDGIPDDWEIANGFNPTNAADALLDTDNDGAINRDEYIAGTNPRDPASVLKAAISTTNGVVLRFVAQTNNSYTVEYRSNVETGSAWVVLSNIGPPASAGPVQVADPGGTTNARRFYRIGTQRLVP